MSASSVIVLLRIGQRAILALFLTVQLAALTSACDKKKGGGNNSESDNRCNSDGQCPQPGLTAQASLTGSLAILVVDPEAQSQGAMLREHNDTVNGLGLVGAPLFELADADPMSRQDGTAITPSDFSLLEGAQKNSGENSLQKVDRDGSLKSALSLKDEKPAGQNQTLPKILTIAVSPQKEVYLHFERPFIYRESPPGANPGDNTSGYQCQIFRIKGGSLESLQANPDPQELECLDNKRFINNWQTQRSSVFQFDHDGNIYYPGAIPNGPNTVVYKLSRDLSTRTEIINSSICVQDFLVTPNGGVFYTGTTSCQNNRGGGGFFRYIAPGNGAGVTEIARDWSNFIFEAATKSDRAVFFGPDPTLNTSASWESACVFSFDPTGTSAATRISKVITCGNNMWDWVNLNRKVDIDTYGQGYNNGVEPSSAWRQEFGRRCTSSGQVFAGGGSQITAMKQDSSGRIYVIGNMRMKKKGDLSCRIDVRGPHCAVNGLPKLTAALSSSTPCSQAGGVWVDGGSCMGGGGTYTNSASCLAANEMWNRYPDASYQSVSGEICVDSRAIVPSRYWDGSDAPRSVSPGQVNDAKFIATSVRCNPDLSNYIGGDQWTQEYKALALVDADAKSLQLKSTNTEQAIRLWMIGDVPYYSAFDTSQGQYYLKRGTDQAVLARNIEVYNLNEAPERDESGRSKLYFDGLDFSNNSYTFGTIGMNGVISKKTGLTGTLKTMVVLPSSP